MVNGLYKAYTVAMLLSDKCSCVTENYNLMLFIKQVIIEIMR